jgi:hypothetical protein
MFASSASSIRMTSPEFLIALRRVCSLGSDADWDDEDRPTNYARTKAESVVRELALDLGETFPALSALSCLDGGIRLHWRREERELRLMVGASIASPSYAYWRRNRRESGIVENINVNDLTPLLRWVTEGI